MQADLSLVPGKAAGRAGGLGRKGGGRLAKRAMRMKDPAEGDLLGQVSLLHAGWSCTWALATPDSDCRAARSGTAICIQ
jgi:hypothetical protein